MITLQAVKFVTEVHELPIEMKMSLNKLVRLEKTYGWEPRL